MVTSYLVVYQMPALFYMPIFWMGESDVRGLEL